MLSLVNPEIMKGIMSYKVIGVKLDKISLFNTATYTRDVFGCNVDVHSQRDTVEIFLIMISVTLMVN
jgi:uncharacterized membrane protein YidH (DUF202 family)